MSFCLKFLCMVEVLLAYDYQLLELKGKFFYSFEFWAEIKIFLIKNAKIISAIELKKCITSIGIFGVLKSKFSHW